MKKILSISMVALIISSAHYCGKKEADNVVPKNTDSTTVSVDTAGKSKPSGKYVPGKYGPTKKFRNSCTDSHETDPTTPDTDSVPEIGG